MPLPPFVNGGCHKTGGLGKAISILFDPISVYNGVWKTVRPVDAPRTGVRDSKHTDQVAADGRDSAPATRPFTLVKALAQIANSTPQIGEEVSQGVAVEAKRRPADFVSMQAQVGATVLCELHLRVNKVDKRCLEGANILLKRGLGCAALDVVHHRGEVDLKDIEGGLNHLRLGRTLGSAGRHRRERAEQAVGFM